MDPVFHALVVARVRELEELTERQDITVDDLSEQDELDILRKYTISLFKEYRTIRTILLDNMTLGSNSVRMKSTTA
jgi:hypothetical protein